VETFVTTPISGHQRGGKGIGGKGVGGEWRVGG